MLVAPKKDILFGIVEIEVNSRCNRRCSYCPVSILPAPPVPKFMDDQTFQRIMEELARIEFTGRISYHFYNEPLIRKDLERLIHSAAQQLPQAQQILYTNGELLTDERYQSLIAAGLAQLIVTSHDSKPVKERPQQVVLYPDMLQLTNRGGTVEHLPLPTETILHLPCHAPNEMMIITVTGDVVLCYEDAQRTLIMGNINQQSIEEIWLSDQFTRYRELLAQGNRGEAAPICRSCSNQAHVEPGHSYFAL